MLSCCVFGQVNVFQASRAPCPVGNSTSDAESELCAAATVAPPSTRAALIAASDVMPGTADATRMRVHRRAGDVDQAPVARHVRAEAVVEHRHAVLGLRPRDVMHARDVHVVLSQAERLEIGLGQSEGREVRSDVADGDSLRGARAASRQVAVQSPDHPERAGQRVRLDHALGAQAARQLDPRTRDPGTGCHRGASAGPDVEVPARAVDLRAPGRRASGRAGGRRDGHDRGERHRRREHGHGYPAPTASASVGVLHAESPSCRLRKQPSTRTCSGHRNGGGCGAVFALGLHRSVVLAPHEPW